MDLTLKSYKIHNIMMLAIPKEVSIKSNVLYRGKYRDGYLCVHLYNNKKINKIRKTLNEPFNNLDQIKSSNYLDSKLRHLI